jgi:hypothetical protein
MAARKPQARNQPIIFSRREAVDSPGKRILALAADELMRPEPCVRLVQGPRENAAGLRQKTGTPGCKCPSRLFHPPAV